MLFNLFRYADEKRALRCFNTALEFEEFSNGFITISEAQIKKRPPKLFGRPLFSPVNKKNRKLLCTYSFKYFYHFIN
jgi:hypothetical protein